MHIPLYYIIGWGSLCAGIVLLSAGTIRFIYHLTHSHHHLYDMCSVFKLVFKKQRFFSIRQSKGLAENMQAYASPR